MNFRNLIIAVMSVVFIAACSNKVKLNYMEPPRVDLSEARKIAVLSFSKDGKIDLRRKVEGALASHFVKNRKYFTIVERSEIEKILREEQGHKWSAEAVAGVRLTNKTQALAVVIGAVTSHSAKSSSYTSSRRKCKSKKSCYDYSVGCQRKDFFMEAQLKVVDIKKGTVTFAKTYSEKDYDKKCSDQSGKIRGNLEGVQNLASKISKSFVGDIAPEEKSMEVALLDSPDIDLEGKTEDEFDRAISFAKAGRTDRAHEILSRLDRRVKSKSYVILYDLGVMEEARGEYKIARSVFESADRLTMEPVKEINQALKRIEKKIGGVPIEEKPSTIQNLWKKVSE